MWERPQEDGTNLVKTDSFIAGVTCQAFLEFFRNEDKYMQSGNLKEQVVLERDENDNVKKLYQ